MKVQRPRGPLSRYGIAGLVLCLLAALLLAPGPLAAQDTPPADDPDVKCLKCHSKKLKKKLEDGDTMILQVSSEDFMQSVHRVIGCTGCHRDIAKAEKHPSRVPIGSRREYSLRHNKTCGQCHAGNFSDYSGSIHASLVAAGNENAPLCSDCHSSHSIQAQSAWDHTTGAPCRECHTEIFEAFSESVHGRAVAEGNVIRNASIRPPVCGDCHNVHEVSAVAASEFLVKACLNCHETAQGAHEEWLPNASLHLTSVSCAACHVPTAERRVNLQLLDKETGDRLVSTELVENEAGEPLDRSGVRELIRNSQDENGSGSLAVRGRVELTSGVDAHRLAPRLLAVRRCESCHQGGAEAFQNVTVSVGTAGGQQQRVQANENLLSSVTSLRGVGGFYAPGATRIKLLDWALVAAIIGGLAVPIGHLTMGRILRKKKEKR